jgi:hypothetical protein
LLFQHSLSKLLIFCSVCTFLNRQLSTSIRWRLLHTLEAKAGVAANINSKSSDACDGSTTELSPSATTVRGETTLKMKQTHSRDGGLSLAGGYFISLPGTYPLNAACCYLCTPLHPRFLQDDLNLMLCSARNVGSSTRAILKIDNASTALQVCASPRPSYGAFEHQAISCLDWLISFRPPHSILLT